MAGKKAQDWSYLSPIRALYTQNAVITDPSDIPDSAIIDTRVSANGKLTERAREQTLVIYAARIVADGDAESAEMGLWINLTWDENDCANSGVYKSSSSSMYDCTAPNNSVLTDVNRWALIDIGTHSLKGTVALANRSSAYVFSHLPAGRYKAGLLTTAGGVVIAEQHTE